MAIDWTYQPQYNAPITYLAPRTLSLEFPDRSRHVRELPLPVAASKRIFRETHVEDVPEMKLRMDFYELRRLGVQFGKESFDPREAAATEVQVFFLEEPTVIWRGPEIMVCQFAFREV